MLRTDDAAHAARYRAVRRAIDQAHIRGAEQMWSQMADIIEALSGMGHDTTACELLPSDGTLTLTVRLGRAA